MTIKFDAAVIFATLTAGLVGHFTGKPLDGSFYGSVALLLGVLTTVTGTAKALQGFEPHSKSDDEVLKETPEDK